MEVTRVTLRDIAKKLKISHVTVSLALRNHPRITEPVRQRVHNMAREMGYRPDSMLVALAHYRITKKEAPLQSAIAWINSWSKPSHLRQYKEFDAYWKGASSCAEKFGYHLEEFAISPDLSSKRLKTILATRSIPGILLPPVQSSAQEFLKDFHWDDFAIVRIGRSWTFPSSHIVMADQFQNAMLAFRKAAEYGYKRIGFIGERNPIRQFVGGYLFEQAQFVELENIPPFLDMTKDSTCESLIIQWIKQFRPDAIITEVARLPEILNRYGYKIPEDLALAGLSLLDGHIDSGIDQQSSEIGRVAVSSIVSLINEHRIGSPNISNQTLVPGIWVDGSMMPKK